MKLKYINYLLVFSFLVFSFSCGDADEDAEASEPLLGIYTISKSVLSSDATSSNGAATIPSGTNITSAIVTAFLSEIDCNSSANKAIEIAENNIINFISLDNVEKLLSNWEIQEKEKPL